MDDEKEEFKHSNKHAETNGNKLGILKWIILGIIIFIVLAIVGTVIWYNVSLSATGTSEDGVTLEIPLGSGTNKIAKLLKDADMIRSETVFKLYIKLNNVTDMQAGKYELTKDMDVEKIVQALKTGKVFKESEVSITFIEGKTFSYYAKEIAKNTNNTEEDVYAVLQNEEYIDSLIEKYWFLTDDIKNKDIYYSLEGYLFPDTYSFDDKDVTVQEILETLLDQMGKVLENYKTDIETKSYNVHKILSIASIIENEAIFDKDRKDISSVIYNRLKANMSIGSDVTTYYAFKIDLGSRDLYKTEINTYNPYNTRGPNMNGKLPVGPICSPGKASIDSAINPNNTDYLFFVADKDGNVYFTKTNAEHQAKVNELKANDAWATF